jgi:DNA polymerase-1
MMKRAKVLLSRALEREGLDHGLDFEWLLDVHDEWQVGCPPEEAQRIGALMAASIADAGTSLALRIPLLGGFKVGSSWKETH